MKELLIVMPLARRPMPPLLLTLALLVLLVLLLQRNFQVRYVSSYTNLAQPAVYVLSALWAGQEGSLLFWGWLLSQMDTTHIPL